MKIFLSLIISISCYSKVITTKAINSLSDKKMEGILTKVFYDELYKITKDLRPQEEVKKAKISLNDGRRGKMIIELLKQKNREKIALMRGLDPKKAKSGQMLVKQQQDSNRDYIKKMREAEKSLERKYAYLPVLQRRQAIWKEQAKREQEEIKKRVIKNKGWQKKHIDTLKDWKDQNKKYLGRVDEYRKALSKIPLVLPVDEKEIKKEVAVVIEEDHMVVSGALSLDIRDQKQRPTCSAFAGLRAIETILNQNDKKRDLSEQYFYWSSKPKCRSRRCSKRGSWVGHGLDFSKSSKGLNIPTEGNCPYREKSITQNETQIPLVNSCQKGVVKVKDFQYSKNLDEVIESLKNNNPVVAGLKLSANFYSARALVLDKDAKASGDMDSHSKGHAVLFIGYLKLPKILNEGKVCLVTANSWGSGWGHGGYACLSEKWILNHRQASPFVSIKALEI